MSNEFFRFGTEFHIDILYHLFAHMDLGQDFTNLYSKEYIKTMEGEKYNLGICDEGLQDKLNNIKDIYIRNNLYILNFLSYKFNCYDELLEALKGLSEDSTVKHDDSFIRICKEKYFTSHESKAFLREFIKIMQYEKESFYENYWCTKQKELENVKYKFIDLCNKKLSKIFLPIIKYENKQPLIYLSLSMTCNGRGGFTSREFLNAAVKFPQREEEFIESFFTAIHEMTHQFVDDITFKAMGVNDKFMVIDYDTHIIRESAVIYTDYLLCKKYLPEHLEKYLSCMLNGPEHNNGNSKTSINDLEEEFNKKFQVPKEVLDGVLEYFNGIEN